MLSLAGLKEGEDLFAPVFDSIRNRWGWLAIDRVYRVYCFAGDWHV